MELREQEKGGALMKRILGRKQTSPDTRWVEAMNRIEELVSRDELDSAVATAIEDIKAASQGKNVAYAWSGGKDSLVLGKICEAAGVKNCMFSHTDLEYPAFLDWCLENKPEHCEVIRIPYDLDWLAQHENMLFPKGRELNKWYQIVQRAAFTKYFFEHNLDMIIVGHRKADGNIVGPDGTIRKGSGEVRYSPLADWPHEMILAYIHYNNINLPPIYKWYNGFRCGTHPWPSRMYTGSIENGWREVYEIDPSIVETAAEKITSARLFLESGVAK